MIRLRVFVGALLALLWLPATALADYGSGVAGGPVGTPVISTVP